MVIIDIILGSLFGLVVWIVVHYKEVAIYLKERRDNHE